VKIDEFQAKQILSQFWRPIPRGEVASNPYEAYEIASPIGWNCRCKAQIHAGVAERGWGKACIHAGEAEELAGKMIGMTLVTHQTGPEGRKSKTVLD